MRSSAQPNPAWADGITATVGPSHQHRSPRSCLSRGSPLALLAEVVLLNLSAPSLPLDSGLAVVGEMPNQPPERA